MGCHFLLQGNFPTQGLNLCPPHWQVDSLLLSHQGSPTFRNTKPKNTAHMRKAIRLQKKRNSWEFPRGPVIRTWHFHYCGPGSALGGRTKILQAMWHGQKKKKKNRNSSADGFYHIHLLAHTHEFLKFIDKGEGGTNWESNTDIHTTMSKVDS